MRKIYFLLLAIFALATGFLVSGQTTRAAEQVSVTTNKVISSYPKNLKFELTAKINDGTKVTKAQLNFTVVGDVATNVREQELGTETAEVNTSLELDTQKYYIPPGVRLKYYWTLFTSAGKGIDTPTQEYILKDERYPFKEETNGLITVRWYEGDASFGKAILDKASTTAEKLSKQYNLKASNPFIIHIYPDERSMYEVLPPNTGEFVGGQAYTEFNAITLLIPAGNLKEVGRGVPHEVSHLIVYQATQNPYNRPPLWLDEGLAVNNQDVVEGFLTQAFQRAVDRKALQTLRTISARFPSDSQLFYQSYGESVSIVQYIIKKYGEPKIGELLNIFKSGVSYDEALTATLGVTMDQLDREWKQSFGYPVAQPLPTTAVPVTVTVGATTAVSQTTSAVATTAPQTALVTTTPATSVAETPVAAIQKPTATKPEPAKSVATESDNSSLVVILAGIAGVGLLVAGASAFALVRRRK